MLSGNDYFTVNKIKSMIKTISLIAAAVVFFSCNNSDKSTKEKSDGKETIAALTNVVINSPLLGSFVGPFGDNKITLLITRVMGDTVGEKWNCWFEFGGSTFAVAEQLWM